MKADEIKEWLNSRSISSEINEGEHRYVHSSGETSLLVLNKTRQGNAIPVTSPLLEGFYAAFSGASIGNGHIVIASNMVGGVTTSHGFAIPDLNEMRIHALQLDMPLHVSDVVFMQVAGWMFILAADSKGAIRQFDRDMRTVREVPSIESVLNEWWRIVLEDPI
jgi:hypothetical protein